MLGKNVACRQAAAVDPAFGNDALTFAEEAWQRAVEADGDLRFAVGDDKA